MLKVGKVLVVVDYQKDFVDGALGFPKAAELEEGIRKLVEEFVAQDAPVVFTLDTHGQDYLDTREGRHLPTPHCLKGSEGWSLYGSLDHYRNASYPHVYLMTKPCFGALNWSFLKEYEPTEVHFVGVVTNMCVISNAILMHTTYPQAEIVIHSQLCASFDPQMHQKALDVMKGLQMEVI